MSIVFKNVMRLARFKLTITDDAAGRSKAEMV